MTAQEILEVSMIYSVAGLLRDGHLITERPFRDPHHSASMPALIGGAKRKEAEQRALELLDAVGLSDRADHKPAQLSGGEQQRVAIARALINRPSVIFADEPTGNLDTHNRDEIQRLLFDVREKFGQTIIMVTHDEKLAEMADRKIVMRDGQIL